jgi:hypothetical protein
MSAPSSSGTMLASPICLEDLSAPSGSDPMLASLILMSDLLGADGLTPHMASAVWQIEHRDGEGAEEGQEPTQASLEIVSLIQR